MDLLANLLGLLAIVTAALAGIAGTGVLAARRLNDLPEGKTTTNDHIAERKNQS